MKTSINFRCPLCEQTLSQEGNSFVCENRHNFDEASEGYLNLLPVQEKNSQQPGDNEEMARSRQRFLDKGYYLPLASKVAVLVSEKGTILDAGCGEGYYLEKIRTDQPRAELIGVDISKYMVRLAAKRKLNAQLAVASNFKLPLFDETVDCVISIFAPLGEAEIARVLKNNGALIMVGPGKNHLKELAEELFGHAHPHEGNFQAVNSSLLTLSSEETLEVKITVPQEDLADLLAMTPYVWRSTLEQKERLTQLESLETTAQFIIHIYSKR